MTKEENAVIAGLRNRARKPLVDSLLFAKGTITKNTFNLFAQSIGSRTKLDTNVVMSGQFPFAFVALGLRVFVTCRKSLLTIDDLSAVTSNMTLNWKKKSKDLVEDLPLMLIPGGVGLVGTKYDSTASTASSTGTNGVASHDNYLKILPEKFEQNEENKLVLTLHNDITVSEDVYVYVVIEGISAETL